MAPTLEGNDDADLTTVLLLVVQLHAVERAVRGDSLVRRKLNTSLKAGAVTRLWTAVHGVSGCCALRVRGGDIPVADRHRGDERTANVRRPHITIDAQCVHDA